MGEKRVNDPIRDVLLSFICYRVESRETRWERAYAFLLIFRFSFFSINGSLHSTRETLRHLGGSGFQIYVEVCLVPFECSSIMYG